MVDANISNERIKENLDSIFEEHNHLSDQEQSDYTSPIFVAELTDFMGKCCNFYKTYHKKTPIMASRARELLRFWFVYKYAVTGELDLHALPSFQRSYAGKDDAE